MHLTAPTRAVFWVSVVLAILALLGFLVPTIPFISLYAFWLALAAYVVLAVGCLLKGA